VSAFLAGSSHGDDGEARAAVSGSDESAAAERRAQSPKQRRRHTAAATTTTETGSVSGSVSGSGVGRARDMAEETPGWEEEYVETREWMDTQGKAVMSDAFRISRWVHWFLLVGGRSTYERCFALDTATGRAALLGRRIELLDDGKDEPLASSFVRFIRPSLHPRWMSDENAVFLECLLRYQATVHVAQHMRLMRHTLRHGAWEGMSHAGPPVGGWAHMVTALARQSQLRFWDPLQRRWLGRLAVPRYRIVDDGADYELESDGVEQRLEELREEAEGHALYGPDAPTDAEDNPRIYGVPTTGPADGQLRLRSA
jgi:hypothetical protein